MNLTTDQWIVLGVIGIVVSGAGVWTLVGLVGYGMTHERKKSDTGDSSGSSRGSVFDWIAAEPVRFRAIVVSVIGALATVLASVFGVDIGDEQIAAIIGVIVAVAFGISEMTRPKVTPVKRVEDAGLEWDPEAGRWRGPDGKFVKTPADD